MSARIVPGRAAARAGALEIIPPDASGAAAAGVGGTAGGPGSHGAAGGAALESAEPSPRTQLFKKEAPKNKAIHGLQVRSVGNSTVKVLLDADGCCWMLLGAVGCCCGAVVAGTSVTPCT